MLVYDSYRVVISSKKVVLGVYMQSQKFKTIRLSVFWYIETWQFGVGEVELGPNTDIF